MRIFALLPLFAVLVFAQSCEKKVKLDTDKAKASYAIGQQIGQNLKGQNIDIDPTVLSASIQDVAEGKPSRMKQEEMQQALMTLQENMNKKSKEESETNLAKGKEFLEKNKTKQGVKTTESGLQIEMITEGTGAKPGPEDIVKVHYKGTLSTGEQFDSSYDRGQPAEFPVNGVIRGWSEALQMMKAGSKAKLYIPSDLGYGPSPRPGIPANSVLVFDVELLEVQAKGKPAAKKK